MKVKCVTESKIQRILDVRAPGSFVELWTARGQKEVQGRISFPRLMFENHEELKIVAANPNGNDFFVGPIKLYLRLDVKKSPKKNMKKKIEMIEKQQAEMQNVLKKLSDMMENSMLVENARTPLPSPGRESGYFSADLKRPASANIAPEKRQKKHQETNVNCNEIMESEDSRMINDINPMVANVRAAVEKAEKIITSSTPRDLNSIESLRNMLESHSFPTDSLDAYDFG